MNLILKHLPILPIITPLFFGALMIKFDDRKRSLKMTFALLSTFLLVFYSALLLYHFQSDVNSGVLIYHLGNWPQRFGISLYVDRLSALMISLTSVMGFCVFLFSLAKWHRAGIFFRSQFQFLLAGLNGAFLTGDLFNLFVFFEVLLAASYGLMLHSSNYSRTLNGLHYIAINLVGSFFFLIGISIVYSTTDALNFIDIANRLQDLKSDIRSQAGIGFAIMSIAFLIKSGAWPLCFWLPNAYTVATTPVSAIFVIMTKVGIYAILRIGGLVNPFLENISLNGLFYIGIVTLIYGAIGVLASHDIKRLATFNVLISSGTFLTAVGFNSSLLLSPVLYYLICSSLALCGLFLLTELVGRDQDPGADLLAITMEVYQAEEGSVEEPLEDEDDEEEEGEGVLIPESLVILGICFLICSLTLVGLPPFAGFIAKITLLSSSLSLSLTSSSQMSWIFVTVLILTSMCSLISFVRTGIRIFWPSFEQVPPRIQLIEIVPILLLISAIIIVTVQVNPIMGYIDKSVSELYRPSREIDTAFIK